jgi:hypothetical protein
MKQGQAVCGMSATFLRDSLVDQEPDRILIFARDHPWGSSACRASSMLNQAYFWQPVTPWMEKGIAKKRKVGENDNIQAP